VEGKKVIALERAKGQVFYWELDFEGATNVLGREDESVLEGYFADVAPGDTVDLTAVNTLGDNGIVPATKSLVMDSVTVQGWSLSSKQEGFAITPSGVLTTIDDNDFGLELNTNSMVGEVSVSEKCMSMGAPASTASGAPAPAPTPPSSTSSAMQLLTMLSTAIAGVAAIVIY
jgi:hypothetical protein